MHEKRVAGPVAGSAGAVGRPAADHGTNLRAAGLTVLDRKDGNPQQPDVAGRQIADGWRAQFGGDMQGVLSFNDETAVGVASALQGDFTPAVVSINAARIASIAPS